jgi:hypothetical protein
VNPRSIDNNLEEISVEEMAKMPNSDHLEIQVGITSQRNKLANMNTQAYQCLGGVNIPGQPTGHIRHEPSFMIMNAELFIVKANMSSTV